MLGSGLGAFADRLASPVVVPYSELPHWPTPSVSGHAGLLYDSNTMVTPLLDHTNVGNDQAVSTIRRIG